MLPKCKIRLFDFLVLFPEFWKLERELSYKNKVDTQHHTHVAEVWRFDYSGYLTLLWDFWGEWEECSFVDYFGGYHADSCLSSL